MSCILLLMFICIIGSLDRSRIFEEQRHSMLLVYNKQSTQTTVNER